MSIVLHENEWAANMIRTESLGKKPSETLRRVARYYMDNGASPKTARRQLDIFLLQCDPTSSLPKWAESLDYAVNRAAKFPAVNIDKIEISDKEMGRIESLEGKQIQRLAFTLLCLAKYWNIVTGKDDGWVNTQDKEIMSLANINTSVKRQCLMYGKLNDIGMIQFSRKVDNTNVKVCFGEAGRTVLSVTDFRNVGYQYLMYHNEPYFCCENCGITTKMNDKNNKRRQKYCAECASIIRTKQSVESVMRRRLEAAQKV